MPSLGERLLDWAEDRTGYSLTPTQRIEQLQETVHQMEPFLDEAEDLAHFSLEMLDELGPRQAGRENRRVLGRRSEQAFIRDPVAGAEANLLGNFSFGRGISNPRCKDDKVQEVVDRAWDDPINQRKLTSFEAQRYRSNELLTKAQLFPVWFGQRGKGRVAFIDVEKVADVVLHPEDDEVPLWYVVRKKVLRWNFTTHGLDPMATTTQFQDGRERVWYYQHWRFVDLADQEAKDNGTEAPPYPPQQYRAEGLVEHVRINRVGRTQWGIPPWARTLRFFSALNQHAEAQVAMAQARASIIAKRTRRTGPKDLLKSASNVLAQGGTIASRVFNRESVNVSRETNPGPEGALKPPPAGSFWMQNDTDDLQAVRLSSGAGEALQDAQLLRAGPAAASGFGQHYFGDPGATDLSTATSLELVSLMAVGSWQETFEGMFSWFTDRAIEEALHAGELGGMVSEAASDARSLQDLHLPEDKEELEARTGLDLSYTFEMPYPGRRNLPDVVNAAQVIEQIFDPTRVNVPLQRALMDYIFRHGMQIEDSTGLVDEILPEDTVLEPIAPAAPAGLGNPMNPDPYAPVDPREQGAQSQYGEKTRAQPPEQTMQQAFRFIAGRADLDQDLREAAEALAHEVRDPALQRQLDGDVAREFGDLLDDPGALMGGRASDKNGHGSANGRTGPLPR